MLVGIRARISRAWKDTRFRWRDVFIAAISIPSLYVLLRSESSVRAAWDEVIAVASGIVIYGVTVVIEFAWNVAVAPYRIRIESLERERTAVKPEPPKPSASLQFGDPKIYPNELIFGQFQTLTGAIHHYSTKVRLWRVELANVKPGTKAEDVAVKLIKTVPDMGLPPIDLHQTHDNAPPYRTRRDVRAGEVMTFDVIAFEGGANSAIFLYRSDLASSYTYRLSDGERKVVRKALREENGLILVLQAVADPPSSGHLMSYRVFLNEKRQFAMEPDSYVENAI
jgi:hypothetical protein